MYSVSDRHPRTGPKPQSSIFLDQCGCFKNNSKPNHKAPYFWISVDILKTIPNLKSLPSAQAHLLVGPLCCLVLKSLALFPLWASSLYWPSGSRCSCTIAGGLFPDTPVRRSACLTCVCIWLQIVEVFVQWYLSQKDSYCLFNRKSGGEQHKDWFDDSTISSKTRLFAVILSRSGVLFLCGHSIDFA